jgi:hypothetical protein
MKDLEFERLAPARRPSAAEYNRAADDVILGLGTSHVEGVSRPD